jgi:hypothetical protein
VINHERHAIYDLKCERIEKKSHGFHGNDRFGHKRGING